MEAHLNHDATVPSVMRFDPALEAAPGGAAERRLHGRAHAYWQSLLGSGRFPLIDDLDLAGVPRLAETSLLFAVTPAGDEPEVNLVGAVVREAWDGPESAMARLITQVRLRLPVLAAHRKPLGFEAELQGTATADTAYRGILLPFGRTGETVDYVLMVVNWKERAGIERDAAVIAAGLYAANRKARCFIDSPWAKALVQDDVAMVPATPEQKLEAARMWAALALTEGLSHAHANKAVAAAYACFAGDDDLTPLAAIDTVFGRDLTRAERCDRAASLRYANRLCLSPDLFLELLEDLGGAAEVAALERAVRRVRPDADQPAGDHFRLIEAVQPRDRSVSPWRGRDAEPIAVEHLVPRRAAQD